MPNEVKIVILAGGKGTRMKSEEPKALLLYKGKPFIQHVLDKVFDLGLKTKPIIVVGYKKERIKEALGKDFEYAEQALQLGTGHAVLSAKNAIGKDCKTILVLSVDQLEVSKNTIQKILDVHQKNNPVITIGTIVVPDFNDWRIGMYKHFGRIIRKDDGTVQKNVEFKDANEKEKNVKELNMALYAFDSNWLWKNINKIENKNAQGEYYLTDLIQIASEQNKKIEAVPTLNIVEAIHPNSKEELEILEKLAL